MGQVSDGLAADYLYTWPADANVKAGTIATPFVFVELPRSIRLDVDRSAAFERGKYAVWFLTDQPSLQFNGVGNEALVDSMLSLAIDFVGRVKALRRHKLFIERVEVEAPIVYDAGDRNLTGVKLMLDLSEQTGYCIPNYTTTCP